MVNVVDYADIKGWVVTAQAADQLIITDAGQPVSGTYVFFATEEGNNGSVFVPDPHYTEKKVHESINTRAALMDRIGKLTRDSRSR